MTKHRARYGPHDPDATYVAHALPERLVDLGEVQMNYATAGDASSPALLLIPGQTESWWGYEAAMPRLAEHFEVFAVDLRGQGRSTRTPGRYTLDTMGNDLVRFIDTTIGRPTWVSGLSSGGVLAAWLSAYAKPGQVIAALYEDPPLFASEVRPALGPALRQSVGPLFDLWSSYLGDQWSVGAWDAMREGAAERLPEWLKGVPFPEEPPQNLKEYDPEWGRAFWTGTVAASCDHERMLRSVKVPVLLTHHLRVLDDANGFLFGAMSDQQAQRVQDLLRGAGVPVQYRSFPDVGHSMHGDRPDLYVDTLLDWVQALRAWRTGSTFTRTTFRTPTGRRCSRRVTSSPTASRSFRPGRRASTSPRWIGSGSPPLCCRSRTSRDERRRSSGASRRRPHRIAPASSRRANSATGRIQMPSSVRRTRGSRQTT